VKKKLFAAGAVLIAILKLASATGAAAGTGNLLAGFVSSGQTAQNLLRAEIGTPLTGISPRVFDGTALLAVIFPKPDSASDADIAEASMQTSPAAESPEIAAPEPSDEPMLFYDGGDAVSAPGGVDNSAPLPSDGIIIKNNSGLSFDADKLLKEPLELNLTSGEPSVLIIHTHSSESYTKDRGESFEESDPYRTEDKEHNIIAVGDALAESLAARGISVVHDRGLNDYPSYAGAYNRSLITAQKYLKEYPTISLVIDLHRDAMETADGSQFKTIADISGELCSQVMLVVGTNGSGLEHPNWTQNMKLALRLQYEMNRSYPTLARPINVAEHRYNQHVAPGALIVEIGATGNTLSESVTAARYFAEAYANVVTATDNS
jgi:stage II sporulation protein P